MAEWLKATDCKSVLVRVRGFESLPSNRKKMGPRESLKGINSLSLSMPPQLSWQSTCFVNKMSLVRTRLEAHLTFLYVVRIVIEDEQQNNKIGIIEYYKYPHWFKSNRGYNHPSNWVFASEAQVDGLPAFNGKVVGSRPTGCTNVDNVSKKLTKKRTHRW